MPHCVFLFRFPLQLLPHRLDVCCTGGMLHVPQGARWGRGIPRRRSLLRSAAINKSGERGAGGGDSLDACNLSKVLAALPPSLCAPCGKCVCVACGKCGIVFNLSKLKSATNRRTTTCNLPPKWTQKTRDLWQTKQTTAQGREGDRQTDKRRTTRAALADSRQVRGVVTGRGGVAASGAGVKSKTFAEIKFQFA